MAAVTSSLTVLFEEPFWIGIYERESNGRYEVCKITFGAEPKDYEVYAFMLRNYSGLRFSPTMEAAPVSGRRVNPKRMQRLIHRQVSAAGIGTKAQQALKLQQEKAKTDRRQHSRDVHEAKKERLFALRQKKRKEKHKGH